MFYIDSNLVMAILIMVTIVITSIDARNNFDILILVMKERMSSKSLDKDVNDEHI